LKIVLEQVEQCEKLILLCAGATSERLVEIYAIRSTIDFNQNKLQQGRLLQKKANKLIVE
jgi:hypothetical protein